MGTVRTISHDMLRSIILSKRRPLILLRVEPNSTTILMQCTPRVKMAGIIKSENIAAEAVNVEVVVASYVVLTEGLREEAIEDTTRVDLAGMMKKGAMGTL